jgi:hypothetical protein
MRLVKHNVVKLDHSFALYIPSTIHGNKAAVAVQQETIDKMLAKMVGMFGGATITQAVGGYKLENGTIVTENVAIIRSCCDAATFEENSEAMFDLACEVCVEMTQECVSLETNGQLNLVSPAAMKAAA